MKFLSGQSYPSRISTEGMNGFWRTANGLHPTFPILSPRTGLEQQQQEEENTYSLVKEKEVLLL